MNGAREDILSAIRRAAVAPDGDPAARMADPRPNLVPARGQGTPDELLARFLSEADAAGGTFTQLASRDEIPAAAEGYLAANNQPLEIKAAPGLKNITWTQQSLLTVDFGRAEGADHVGITEAFAGIAETGTLMVLSGAENPASLNFLPDTHLVVLDTSRIVGAYEDGWALLRGENGKTGFMPRMVNWITGPSRSADIELILLLGVHGPRRLHILLIDG
ncbi:MAG: lactate utilization protein [Rhodospirillales bacterium]|jgi:L-lactate dehydrogenase complex protein LldG|nr:lactate utilization protein [Rhodospirillales bacterium]